MEKKIPKKQKKEESEEEDVEEVQEEEEEEDQLGEDFVQDPRVLTYATEAGKISDEGLQYVISLLVPGASIYKVIQQGDAFLRDKLKKCFTKKRFIKSLAYPVTISVNEVAGNFNPIEGDESKDPHFYQTVSEGDVVKVDLGVQIEGIPAVVSHTVVISSKSDEVVTGRKADVVLASYYAVQVALRLMNTKRTNNEITQAIQKVADSYHVSPVEGVLSHRMKRDIIDGPETIINKTTFDQKVDSRNFAVGDIFGMDVIFSSGEGKPKETEIKTTIHKRALETTYKLKQDSSRKLLSIIEKNFYTFPFSISSFDNEDNIHMTSKINNFKTVARAGLIECVQHELLHPYPVLSEKKGEFVSQFKYTIAVKDNGPYLLSGIKIDVSKFKSEYKIEDEEINKLLAQSWDEFVPKNKKEVVQTKSAEEKKKRKKENKAKKEEAEKNEKKDKK